MGPGTLAWVIFALVLVLLLLAIASLAIDAYHRRRTSQPVGARAVAAPTPATSEALAALDARYARGEIPRDEYLQARDRPARDGGGDDAGDSAERGAGAGLASTRARVPGTR